MTLNDIIIFRRENRKLQRKLNLKSLNGEVKEEIKENGDDMPILEVPPLEDIPNLELIDDSNEENEESLVEGESFQIENTPSPSLDFETDKKEENGVRIIDEEHMENYFNGNRLLFCV